MHRLAKPDLATTHGFARHFSKGTPLGRWQILLRSRAGPNSEALSFWVLGSHSQPQRQRRPNSKASSCGPTSRWACPSEALHALSLVAPRLRLRPTYWSHPKLWLKIPPTATHLRVAVDASPWGIGGLLLANDVPSRWFADKITDDDLKVFNASRGDPAFNILWRHSPRRHLPHSTGQQPSLFQYVSTHHWSRR